MADFAIDDVDTINLLAAAVDGRTYPDASGQYLRYFYRLEDDPDDSAEADMDLVVWLIEHHYLTTAPDHTLTPTDLGRSELDSELFVLEILTAIHEGRAYPTGNYDRGGAGGRRRLFAYRPADDDQFEGRSFALAPLVEETGEVELDRAETPHLTDVGRERLKQFGVLDPDE